MKIEDLISEAKVHANLAAQHLKELRAERVSGSDYGQGIEFGMYLAYRSAARAFGRQLKLARWALEDAKDRAKFRRELRKVRADVRRAA